MREMIFFSQEWIKTVLVIILEFLIAVNLVLVGSALMEESTDQQLIEKDKHVTFIIYHGMKRLVHNSFIGS